MANQSVCLVFLIFAWTLEFCVGQYAIPTIKFEAFTPKGLRISIPADKGVELFAFHGKLNKPILQIEPGEFSEDVTRPSSGRFIYFNPSIRLKEGDVINYWVFVQHDQLGFRKDDQSWTVDKLDPQENLEKEPGAVCGRSVTKVQGKTSVCAGDNIINYSFTETTLNPDLWQIEQYIPTEPDWEYVVYRNEPDVIGIENNALRIKPKVVEENLQQNIEIVGCTHPDKADECSRLFSGIYQPPIVSGRLVSKTSFSFANITIRAKLPQGDWLYPEIFLEDVKDLKKRILVAYARGNKELTGNEGDDIGGKLLFGGPHATPKEPNRSKYLRSYRSPSHIGDEWHTFTVLWTGDQIMLYIDGVNYGTVNADGLQSTGFQKDSMVRLVLGVGVGGTNDFPDNYKSGTEVKPWKSLSKIAVKQWWNKKDAWLGTWNDNNQLLVEYVTIKAI